MEPSESLKQSLLSVCCCSSTSASVRCFTHDDRHDQRQRKGNEEDFYEPERLSVDEVLDKYVGGFGPAQVARVLIVSLAWIFDAMHTLIAIFTDSQPSWQCVGSESTSDFRKNATQQIKTGCTKKSSICEMDSSLWEWIDGRGSSIVSEWILICHNQFKAGIPASLFFIGCILGGGILGSLSDTSLGRKRTLMLSSLIMSVSGFLTALSPNIWVYSFLRLVSGFGRAGVGVSSLVLSTESVGTKWRAQIGLYGFIFFSAGMASLSGIAYLARFSWRIAYVSISALSMAYCCVLLPFVDESPRWLAIKKTEPESLGILKKMASRNGKILPENVRISVCADQDAGATNSAWAISAVLKVPCSRRRMVVVMGAAVGTGLVFFGLQLNITNLNFNPYILNVLNALMEIPGIAIGSLLLPRTNRRIFLSVSSIMCALFCFACIFFSQLNSTSYSWLQILAEMISFLAACTSVDILYIFCLELFPTNVSNVALSTMRQAMMAGAAVAPAVVVMGRIHSWLSFLAFGGFALLTAVFIRLLPETRNRRLHETLEEQDREEGGGSD